MAIQEILETQAAKTVEIEILQTITEVELSMKSTYSKPAIQHLLHVRKKILDSMFVLTDEYKQLLYDFNESMKYAFGDMRRQMIDMQKAAIAVGITNLEVTGKVFMSYKYPVNHPVQTIRALMRCLTSSASLRVAPITLSQRSLLPEQTSFSLHFATSYPEIDGLSTNFDIFLHFLGQIFGNVDNFHYICARKRTKI